ncbi:nuclear receptor-interacting protein 1 [Xyrauchen texanus]|uniref:nuclear receptor-interacting protein 1 n=1 Tax=Xyrauchen texanus TaxID=154827 RepID=UPI0022427761|nr:nuclear receptor-interacting protein 1 [Xyrauchen texanus]XP_051973742.1 nuclear receptor-interacting protein 1 [Xyrauchen texanus]XP_051973743.1 nuclear receptor-interacting protein 1 [Xyrauchen texanus]
MTHGVESGPETHQDSTALTYLEGLLMHPITTGPTATATLRSEPDHNNEENANKVTRAFLLPNHGSASPDKGSPPSASSQHLKKARLLRSGAWSVDDSKKQAGDVVEVSGRGLDGPVQGESTLLASLLQSFSSQLQSVALSQHISQSHKQFNRERSESSPVDKETQQSYSTASGHLKSLMRKSKQQNHNTVPYCRRSNQNRSSESPRSIQSSDQPTASESMSCTERLKAVANIVQARSSPAPSPKPSVACSQLALLLSSEVHLQQYSREQALKAQLASRSASERLAAMATQQTQDKRPPSMGLPSTSPNMLSSLTVQNGTLSPPALNSSKRSPSIPLSSPRDPKERRPFDRHSRPSQNCSSLLLLLLNNHNAQQQLTKNGHMEDDRGILPSQATSLQSDSDYSNQENSLTKDSSDAESFSSCSPIDLSMRGRLTSQKSEACSSLTSSLDKLTESLINKWKPEPSAAKVHEAMDLDASPDMKSHDKVTLMQLLLERRNNKVNKGPDNPGLQPEAVISSLTAGPLKRIGTPEDSRTWSPLDWQTGGCLSTFSSVSPSYSYPSPRAQSSPLDLCKSKSHSSEKMAEPSFSASKLLQNLAQSGVNNLSPSPPLHTYKSTSRRQSPKLDLDKPQALLNQFVSPIKQNRTSMLDRPPATFTPHKHEQSLLASTQLENLLEKRTVLQLLLGTASHKERSSMHRVSEVTPRGLEKPQWTSATCDSSNGPLLNVKIKTEPVEENLSSDSSDDGMFHQRQSEQPTPISEAQDKIKSELCPKETAEKFEFLSQLLKEQNATYLSKPHNKLLLNSVKEESLDFHSPAPKKRKLCIELAEHLNNELCQVSGDTTSDNLVSGTSEYMNRQLIRPMEEDLARSPRSKAPLSRESQGFNVLKQLLLSENCLKELSQPRGTLNPFLPAANGNLTQSGFSHELSNLPWYPYSLSTGPGVPKSVSTPASHDSNGESLLWAKGSPKASPKPVKQEPEGSPGETFIREERSSPNSPPFTRSNPILYYMLQQGNGQLRNEIRDQEQPAHCAVSLKVEPCCDNADYYHRINSLAHRQTPSQREENLNGSVEKW